LVYQIKKGIIDGSMGVRNGESRIGGRSIKQKPTAETVGFDF